MTLQQITQRLELTLLNPKVSFNTSQEVGQAHASDLLSDVLANAPGGGLLLTIQVHLNVIAVAVHAGLAAVVFTSGLAPEQQVLERAAAEGLPLFSTRESTFDVAGKLYALGLRGRHE
jgi:predicted transcriptional regulator